MITSLVVLENGFVLGSWNCSELPKRDDIIQIQKVNRFWKVKAVVWVVSQTIHEGETSRQWSELHRSKMTRVIVEDADLEENSPYILKALERVEAQGL